MTITLKPELEQVIEDQLKTGRYQSADEVLEAALGRLIQADQGDDFAPGELEELLAVAEADVERGDVSDGEAVFERMRQKGEEFRRSSGHA